MSWFIFKKSDLKRLSISVITILKMNENIAFIDFKIGKVQKLLYVHSNYVMYAIEFSI